MVTFINMTPHEINLNDGRNFPPSGFVIRVNSKISEFDDNQIARTVWGNIECIKGEDFLSKSPLPEILPIPPQEDGVFYIVSGIVASRSTRDDFVSPATGHRNCIRGDDGKNIVSVPGFIR